MRRLMICLVLMGVLFLVSGCGAAAKDELFDKFENPPAEAKPFVRWWWGENSVAAENILREIEVMDKAGIGGFEINPIALPVKVKLSSPSLEWLSPEFNRMVKIAVDETKDRGMIADLIVGSGWPFGAEFLKPGEMTKRFYMNSIAVEGPVTFTKSIDELSVPVNDRHLYERALKPECQFIYLAPADISEISQSVDITGKINDGMLSVKVPAGKYIVHVGLVQEGFRKVMNGSPGAMGPVLDHYNSQAVRKFLDRMSRYLGPALGGEMGPAVRAIFCDSIELSASNWTKDTLSVFKDQHGYDAGPYLPYIVDFKKPIEGDDKFSDQLKRVRYDYCKTLVDMFQERFIKVYHKWSNDNGCLSRYQAYGTPWYMGMLDGYLIPDIPETNNWLFSDPDGHGFLIWSKYCSSAGHIKGRRIISSEAMTNTRGVFKATLDQIKAADDLNFIMGINHSVLHGFLIWSKYCSSAGHIKGRRIISSEAMTNTRGVFKATLDQIKAADDLNFIMGINHSVLHGFTYSPLEEGPFARVRYGAYFSDQNTWWPYFRKWSEYNGRLSAVFQNSKPVVSVAILGPRADIWSKNGLERPPFNNSPWYLPQLWKVFSQCGSSSDHVSEPVVQNASSRDGKLECGEMSYDALIVAGAESMEPETTEMLLGLAKAGVKIVFIDKTPARGPSLNDLGAGDKKVKENIQSVLACSNVFKVGAPDSKKPWEKSLLSWADKLLNTIEVKRDVTLNTLDSSFYQMRMRDGGRDIFFLVNTDSDRSLIFDAAFNSKGKTVWQWDPETGKRTVFASPVSGPIDITLGPHGSLLLVFEAGGGGKASVPQRSPGPGSSVAGTWDCHFLPAHGEAFGDSAFKLVDLGKSKKKKLNTFAGVITYRKTVQIKDVATAGSLDLGTVQGVSEVTVNGKDVGIRWYGQHLYDISNAVKGGENELVIKVTTVLYNYARTLDKKSSAGFWAGRGKKAVSAGLIGPVKIR